MKDNLQNEVLQKCISVGNEYGFISWDSLLDECDEDITLVRYVEVQLTKMLNENKIDFELDF
jgi:hypothetical protein